MKLMENQSPPENKQAIGKEACQKTMNALKKNCKERQNTMNKPQTKLSNNKETDNVITKKEAKAI